MLPIENEAKSSKHLKKQQLLEQLYMEQSKQFVFSHRQDNPNPHNKNMFWGASGIWFERKLTPPVVEVCNARQECWVNQVDYM